MRGSRFKIYSYDNELYPGLPFKEVRVFVLQMIVDYLAHPYVRRVPQTDILVNDIFKEFYNGKEPEGVKFPVGLLRIKVNQWKANYRTLYQEKQIRIIFP